MGNKKELSIKKRSIEAAELKIREKDGAESRTITGYSILFNTPSVPLYEDESIRCIEVISPDAVTLDLLNKSDIKMTLFHNRERIMARSNAGSGTLKYGIDERGVYFEFDAPNTADGNMALELVRRGDISGCSFAFSTYYNDDEFVERKFVYENEKKVTTFTIRKMIGVYDFTLAIDPAYPDTSCEARELINADRAACEQKEKITQQVRAMRHAATSIRL